jgi:alpha-tubulin suppressor-like RCC1 family protein
MKKLFTLLFINACFCASLLSQSGNVCWREFSAGTFHSLAIKIDGTLWAWGSNLGGQLGDGSGLNKNLPTQIGTATDWMKVSAGANHSLAIKTNGTLWAWGNDFYGAMGNGPAAASGIPVQIGTATDWQEISGGTEHSLGIKNNGTLWAWGYNFSGQLGDNTVIDKNAPTQIGTAIDWLRIDAGSDHSLGIKTDSTLWAWGNDFYGQLGDGTNTNSLVPIQIGTDKDWQAISGAHSHSMALKYSGTLWTWGQNNAAQLGIGNYVNKNTPTLVLGGSPSGSIPLWKAISGGVYFSLAIKNDGTLWSWGYNAEGQLGLSISSNAIIPNQVGTDTNWVNLSAGFYHSLILDNNFALWSTGKNTTGQLGVGTNTNSNTLLPIACPTTVLGVKDYFLNTAALAIYPNPTKDIINIKNVLSNIQNGTVKLMDGMGKIILAFNIDNNSKLQYESISLKDKTNGIYLLSIVSETKNYYVKIIKE